MLPNFNLTRKEHMIKGRYMALLLILVLFNQHLAAQLRSPGDFDKLLDKATLLMKQNERKQSFDTLFYALNEAKRQQSDKYFDVLTTLTYHLYYSDTYGELYPLQDRLRLIDEAISLAAELKRDSIYTRKVYHKAVLYQVNQISDSALFYFNKTIDWATKVGNDDILLQAYNFKSRIFRDRGDLDAAYALLIAYEQEATRLDHRLHLQTVTEALGNFFTVQQNHEKSISFFKKAIELARNNDIDAYYSLVSLAGEYIDTDSTALARQMLGQALEEIERVDGQNAYSQDYDYKKMAVSRTLGYLYAQKLQQYDSALYHYQQGLSKAKELNHQEAIAETRENIAGIYLDNDQYREALDMRIQNYPLILSITNLHMRVQVERNMAQNYELLGMYEKAIEHFKINRRLSDSLLNIQQLEAVTRLETEYETEKKEQEIALLSAKNDKQQARQAAFMATGTMLLILLVIVIIALRNKQKNNRLITRQKEALADSNEQLRELGEFKENLTHMIVHDMKNPLNAVIGLSRGEVNGQKLNTIAQSGQQMLNMVSNMLDVQKFKEAKVALHTETHAFATLFQEASIHLELLLHAKNVRLSRSFPERLYVDVDGELIVRVIGNLLSNALKFSELGGKIEVEATEDQTNGEVTISVKDYGPGIPADQLPNVFDKYWQGEDKSLRNSGSTGLGLTFCKLAIEAHGGKIKVQSEYGQSTTFSFTIPMVPADDMGHDDIAVAKPMDLGESLIFASDIAVLSKYFAQLDQLKVHQVGKISSIIRALDEAEVKSPWKSDLVSAMHQGNQQRFEELVEMLR
ncbi:MAG: hypothetical protein Roseis2KO_53480 [Roseivirga sp.]